jgi:hypothetical protein
MKGDLSYACHEPAMGWFRRLKRGIRLEGKQQELRAKRVLGSKYE